jgi:hypothetical protein
MRISAISVVGLPRPGEDRKKAGIEALPVPQTSACRLAYQIGMRQRFYRLLKEYLTIVRECELCQEQVLAAPQGIEHEQASRKLELTRKRCAAVRREIRRYPDINTLSHAKCA